MGGRRSWISELRSTNLEPLRLTGDVVEGRSRESIYRDGRWWDELAMSVLESDWRKLKAEEAASDEERAELLAEAAAAEASEADRSRRRAVGLRRRPSVLERTIRRFT